MLAARNSQNPKSAMEKTMIAMVRWTTDLHHAIVKRLVEKVRPLVKMANGRAVQAPLPKSRPATAKMTIATA
jgi:hypothetical protein